MGVLTWSLLSSIESHKLSKQEAGLHQDSMGQLYMKSFVIDCESINNHNLYTYIKVKPIKIENYVMLFIICWTRSYLAQFKCHVLLLYIESRRLFGIKEDRICKADNK